MPNGKKKQRTVSPHGRPPPHRLLPPRLPPTAPSRLGRGPYTTMGDRDGDDEKRGGYRMSVVLASLWKLMAGTDRAPTEGSMLLIKFDKGRALLDEKWPGIALRKDLNNVQKWLEASNKDLGKIAGIRWLSKETILTGEGKTASSVVVYLEGQVRLDKVRLEGKWLKTSQYDWDRGRK
ncbi:hypothetical protein BDZ91DRAFT_853038 [Kalaharituber pfeilii]|nr:hypothetical protein BDZ91DRAFT_853038 [Kalaharituber pfeilii]